MPQLTCSNCKQPFTVAAIGDSVTCPNCQATFAIRIKTSAAPLAPVTGVAAESAAVPIEATPESPFAPAAPAPAVEDEFALQPMPGEAPVAPADTDELALQPAPVVAKPVVTLPAGPVPPLPAASTPPVRPVPAAAKKAVVKAQPPKSPSKRQPQVSESGEPLKTSAQSPLGWALAGVGGCMMLAAVVILLISPLRAPTHSAAELKKQQDAGVKEVTDAFNARKPLEFARDTAAGEFKNEQTRAAELGERSKRLDQNFETLAAANARNFTDFKQKQEQSDRTQAKTQEALAQFGEGTSNRSIPMLEKSVVVVITDCGSGSGFVLNDSGLVATNYHVVEGCSKLTVKLQKRDSKEQTAIETGVIKAVDPERDLALIQLPACPAEIGENGKYPSVSLRLNQPAMTGENVMAIGNPGLENIILDYTVTKGIVSNADRSLDGKKFLQVSAVVNPGNSGGPLFDSQGNVLGVVAAKGINVEAMTFVIPARDLSAFWKRMGEDPCAVKDGLEAWEKVHRPLTALQRKRAAMSAKPTVEFNADPTGMIEGPDGKTLYILFGLTGRVQEFDLKTRKLGRECRTECVLTDLVPYGANGEYALTHSFETAKTLRINLKTMSVSGEVKTMDAAVAAAPFGAIGYALLLRERGIPWLINQTHFDKSSTVGLWPLGDESTQVHSAASNARWLLMAAYEAGTTTFKLQAYPLAQCQPYISQLADLKRRNNGASTFQEEAALKTKIDGLCKTFDLSMLVTIQEGKVSRKMLTWAPGDHFIFARRVFKTGVKLECEGSFDASPYTDAVAGQPKSVRDDIHYMENIFTVSPSGKYAVSGLCIYDISTRKIFKQLPFPSAVHTFINDGKGMVLLSNRGLFCFDDWQTDFPAPDAK